MLWVCSGIAIASAVLALAFLPGRAPASGVAADVSPADDTTGADAHAATSALDKSRMTT